MKPKLPAGHPVPPSGQAVASKCPFLAAEMGQKNSSVVRQVSMEFQEDVQEVRTVQKGKGCLRTLPAYNFFFCLLLCRIQCYFDFLLPRPSSEVSPAQLKKPSLASTSIGSEQEPANLMRTLLKQRPKMVSHLLQDNLPGNSTFYFHVVTLYLIKKQMRRNSHSCWIGMDNDQTHCDCNCTPFLSSPCNI